MLYAYTSLRHDINSIHIFYRTRELFDFLPLSNRDPPPRRHTDDSRNREEPSLDPLVPLDPNIPYDMHEVIQKIVDDGNFFEIMPDYAKVCMQSSLFISFA